MCGLNAIYAYHEAAPSPTSAELLATRDYMTARGPDGEGAWTSASGRAALAHRRLAIIDLDQRASQPMVSACGRFVLVFNGEIYNYRELRAELLAQGATLRTQSDTEVVLELFARHGADALARLIGMFAIAIWDEREAALFLARDTYGIKPLYYADDGWTVRAASQVKALLAGGAVSRDPDPAGVTGFLLWGNVPEPFTLYQQVRTVRPGHIVRIDKIGVHDARPFLTLAQLYALAGNKTPEPDAIRDAVMASVRRHLVADVPVGLFLSAGIDSNAILAAIHAIDPALAANTTAVTLAFEEFAGSSSDEAPLAAETAKMYGARHVVRTVGRSEFEQDLPRILEAMDQPSIDGINSWFVSKAASQAGLKVALSGVGGDELFAGYGSFRDLPRWHALLTIPSHVPGASAAWAGMVQLLRRGHPKMAGLLRHGSSWAGLYLLRRGVFLPHELKDILDSDVVDRGVERLAKSRFLGRELAAPKAAVPHVSLMESAYYMRNQLLRDADWASMAHSLEVRTPFVDAELLRRILPYQADLKGKSILAQALDLPDQLRNRKKTGFTTPVANWMREKAQSSESKSAPWARDWARFVMDHVSSAGRLSLPEALAA